MEYHRNHIGCTSIIFHCVFLMRTAFEWAHIIVPHLYQDGKGGEILRNRTRLVDWTAVWLNWVRSHKIYAGADCTSRLKFWEICPPYLCRMFAVVFMGLKESRERIRCKKWESSARLTTSFWLVNMHIPLLISSSETIIRWAPCYTVV